MLDIFVFPTAEFRGELLLMLISLANLTLQQNSTQQTMTLLATQETSFYAR